MKEMEDYRRLAVIAAGYAAEMKGLLEANPGLSRVLTTLHFGL